ncbi:sialic acid-binding Ig-like lectin 14 [Chanos chanos]|uniref:Sialic acid-binding Ig-like lectin 14 n=1 Tax=Chanos chanos TaxID=29144 RepID=A0A6J2VF31_CHACN|nr:sialic acid-binding Ig-like lectin 14 [Chanos chanos]
MFVIIYFAAIGVLSTDGCYIAEPTGRAAEFSIRVARNKVVEAGLCAVIPCAFTYPHSLVQDPYKRVWFKGDPLNPTVEIPYSEPGEIALQPNERSCSIVINDLVEGENDGEYGFKLEWGAHQTYIFPERVRVSVTALSKKPSLHIPRLMVGQPVTLSCEAPGRCSGATPDITWELNGLPQRATPGNIMTSTGEVTYFSEMLFIPKAKHHNTSVTCRVLFKGNVTTEITRTLTVNYRPRILSSSGCAVQQGITTCICISEGVPLPVIDWNMPEAKTGKNSVMMAESSHTMIKSTIILPSSNTPITKAVCVSKNAVGVRMMTMETDKQ